MMAPSMADHLVNGRSPHRPRDPGGRRARLPGGVTLAGRMLLLPLEGHAPAVTKDTSRRTMRGMPDASAHSLPRDHQRLWQRQVQLSRGHWRREDAAGAIRSAGWWESVTVTWSPAPAPRRRPAVLQRALATAADMIAPVLADVAAASTRRLLDRRHRVLPGRVFPAPAAAPCPPGTSPARPDPVRSWSWSYPHVTVSRGDSRDLRGDDELCGSTSHSPPAVA
jgi:hypothetical protein